MAYSKMALIIIFGTLLFAGGLISGIIVQNYLNILPQQTQNSSTTTNENLTVQNYMLKPFTKAAIEFTIKNTGTTSIQITSVAINGYLNQTVTPYWTQGWNGTTSLQKNETGIIYVYLPCYIYALNSSIPQLSSPPTQTELGTLEEWINTNTYTFTFTTTQKQYNYTVSNLGFFIMMMYMGSLTTGEMATEGITFTGYQWASPSDTTIPWIILKVKNTGSADLSIAEVRVDSEVATTNLTLPYSLSKGSEVSINITKTFTRGVQYNFYVTTSKGHEFGPYTLPAP
jgi:hypothetical protein